MNKKDLKFLDFILPVLIDRYPDSITVSDLNSMYKKERNIDFGYRELSIFVDTYENEYFDRVSKIRHLRILTDWIDIINEFGSLSKYLDFEKNKQDKIDKGNNEIKGLQKEVLSLQKQNLILSNRRLKREILFGIIGFILASIITNLKDILILMNLLPPK